MLILANYYVVPLGSVTKLDIIVYLIYFPSLSPPTLISLEPFAAPSPRVCELRADIVSCKLSLLHKKL